MRKIIEKEVQELGLQLTRLANSNIYAMQVTNSVECQEVARDLAEQYDLHNVVYIIVNVITHQIYVGKSDRISKNGKSIDRLFEHYAKQTRDLDWTDGILFSAPDCNTSALETLLTEFVAKNCDNIGMTMTTQKTNVNSYSQEIIDDNREILDQIKQLLNGTQFTRLNIVKTTNNTIKSVESCEEIVETNMVVEPTIEGTQLQLTFIDKADNMKAANYPVVINNGDIYVGNHKCSSITNARNYLLMLVKSPKLLTDSVKIGEFGRENLNVIAGDKQAMDAFHVIGSDETYRDIYQK